MNYGDLKTRITGILHRPDLVPKYDDFALDATERVNARFGTAFPTLLLDTDTNAVLEAPIPLPGEPAQPTAGQLYVCGMLEAAYLFLNDGENAMTYSQRFDAAANQVSMAGKIPELDPYTVGGLPPAIVRSC
jgi:hypothetical protein